MTIGEKLRQAREARSITLHEIAEKTNISVRSLDALEKGQVDKLPGGIFTRGFVRSYAAYVGLDPDEIVREYVAAHPEVRTPEEAEEMEPPRSPLPMALGLFVLAALLLAAGYYWWSQRPAASGRPQAASTSAQAPEAPAPVAPPAPVDVLPDARRGDAGTPADEQAPAPAPPPSTAPASASPAAAATVPADADQPLRLTLMPTGRCWVRVRADGAVRVSRELAAGDRVDVTASEVLEILAGDAGAFAYRINGVAGRSLGSPGAVGRATITLANVAEFQAAP